MLIISTKREGRRSDSVLWQKRLYQQKIRKPMDNKKRHQKFRLHNETNGQQKKKKKKRHQKFRLHSDCGPN